jgi:predicted nuclease of predicted toxin-antitoxin system
MEVRYHLDEQVARAVAVGLRLHSIDVTTTADSGLLGTSDVTQLSFASAEQRVLVTHDRDFLKLHATGTPHAGIAYCHQDKLAIGQLIRSLLALHGTNSAEDLRNTVAFL